MAATLMSGMAAGSSPTPDGRPGRAQHLVRHPAHGSRRPQPPRTPSFWHSQQRPRLFSASVLRCCRRAARTDSSQGAKLFLSDTLAMPSRPGVPQSSSVAADVLTSRPEVREWMLSTVDTLKRGKPPSLPSLIAEQQILRDSMNSTGGSMHNLLLIYHRWQTREGASCIAELLGGHFEDLGPAARRQSVEPWPSCIGAPTRALDHRLSCEAAHPTAGAPPSNSWHCCDGG